MLTARQRRQTKYRQTHRQAKQLEKDSQTDLQASRLCKQTDALTHRQAGRHTSLSPADALAPPPAEAEAEDSPELVDDPPDELEDELDDPAEELEDELSDELDDESLEESLDVEVEDPSVERMLEASSKLGGPLKENWTPVGNVPVCPFLSITPKAVSCKTRRKSCEKTSFGLQFQCAAVG